ncbi:hypothetical protein [Pelotalea chapellei]|uniref:hypothetical protein n=1 Tax=Pelotalea chapellei TaxID=44671 RepID=UPI001FEA9763|nr:hypothetical protein [Pelotalea chapellei]
MQKPEYLLEQVRVELALVEETLVEQTLINLNLVERGSTKRVPCPSQQTRFYLS